MKNLKLLILSALVTLIFALPHAIHGTDMKREENDENRFQNLPKEIKREALKQASVCNIKKLDNENLIKNENPIKRVKLVCKDWCSIVRGELHNGKSNDFTFVNEVVKSAYSLSKDDYEVYQRFINGILVYRPNGSYGEIRLRISRLANPLEGTFDLSKCNLLSGENVGKDLSISTGYRKDKKAENANKVEIWFTPRFLVENDLTTTAAHFQGIYGNWNDSAPVGMFWTWGNWDDLAWYHYLTHENMENLSKINLHDLAINSSTYTIGHIVGVPGNLHTFRRFIVAEAFSCSFCELK